MINLQNISVSFSGKDVLKDVNIEIKPKEHVCFMGPSGCGKTTLARVILGLLKPQSGKVFVQGEKTAYLFQEPRLLPWLTAMENVNLVLSDNSETYKEAEEWLRVLGLSDSAEKKPAELSGGMRQRVSLARALAFHGDIIILDEPLKGLDEEMKAKTIDIIKSAAKDKTLVLITHDTEEALALCGKIYTFENKNFIDTSEKLRGRL